MDAVMVNNDDWLSEIKYLTFFANTVPNFSINRMLSFESVNTALAA
jgi:tyrosyl-tRNA synthetase